MEGLEHEVPRTRRVLVTARVPASLWQLFRLALVRERFTMQRWVEGVVSRALSNARVEVKARTRRSRSARRERRRGDGERDRGRAGTTGPIRQIVARLESDQLVRLRTLCEAAGLQVNEWFIGEIERFVSNQQILGIDLVGLDVLKKLRGALPVESSLR